jgi:hypothetical protein
MGERPCASLDSQIAQPRNGAEQQRQAAIDRIVTCLLEAHTATASKVAWLSQELEPPPELRETVRLMLTEIASSHAGLPVVYRTGRRNSGNKPNRPIPSSAIEAGSGTNW